MATVPPIRRGSELISTPTVLILGAGSSTHLGYPLGRQLVANLCKLRSTKFIEDLPNGWTRQDADRFLTRLARADPNSIDAFLESVPEYQAIGKYFIARELKGCEDVDSMFPPHDAGWYRYLVGALLGDHRNPRFQVGTLGIITFNYDRSLEAYLHHSLESRLDLDSDRAAAMLSELPIIHVHGMLGTYPDVPYRADSSTEELLAISRQIRIISEIEDVGDGFCNEMFERANALLRSAQRIYFLGFGFHADNIRRLRFFEPGALTGKDVMATAPSMGPVVKEELYKRMEPFGFPHAWTHVSNCNNFFQHARGLD
jgi:hypothetical protein